MEIKPEISRGIAVGRVTAGDPVMYQGSWFIVCELTLADKEGLDFEADEVLMVDLQTGRPCRVQDTICVELWMRGCVEVYRHED